VKFAFIDEGVGLVPRQVHGDRPGV